MIPVFVQQQAMPGGVTSLPTTIFSSSVINMPIIRLIQYGSCEYHEMVKLRDVVLRRPLGLNFTESYLQQEINDVLIGCFEQQGAEALLVGCCILTPVDKKIVQLRQMAVQSERQGRGIGRVIIAFAEQYARDNGFTTMMMHARKTAIDFYRKLGYEILGEAFLEVGIPHYEMRKLLIH